MEPGAKAACLQSRMQRASTLATRVLRSWKALTSLQVFVVSADWSPLQLFLALPRSSRPVAQLRTGKMRYEVQVWSFWCFWSFWSLEPETVACRTPSSGARPARMPSWPHSHPTSARGSHRCLTVPSPSPQVLAACTTLCCRHQLPRPYPVGKQQLSGAQGAGRLS